MGKIKSLPRQVVDKIAAGEVIERPASAVKELMENSIDAGASSIDVYFTDGGREKILVIDDGEGMTPEDMEMAIQSHTTSKLVEINDLWRLSSLGFRGEALASIVSIARVSILSRTHHSATGMRLRVEGGEVQELEAAGAPPGTSVEVRDLFFNTPARRKFLHDHNRESGFILQQIIPLALAHPHLKIRAVHNNKQLLRTSGRGEVLNAWGDIFDHSGREHFVTLEPVEKNYVTMEGFLGLPPLARSTGRGIYLFVNGRPFYNRQLIQAVLRGYEEMLPPGRYPQALIFLRLNPIHLDINVHPTKREVSFSQLPALAQNLTELIAQTLPRQGGPLPSQNTAPSRSSRVQEDPGGQDLFTPTLEKQEAPEEKTRSESSYSPLHQIFQVHQAYLLVETAGGLYIIDQHAAHERILYNRLAGEMPGQEKKQSRKNLLTPLPFNLDPTQEQEKEKIKDYLTRLNFQVEDFGPRDLLLRAVPLSLGPYLQERAGEVVRDLIELFTEEQREKDFLALKKKALQTMACHRAVKFGGELSSEERKRLVEDLFATEPNSTCPHGRPVFKKFSWSELEKMFNR